MISVHLNTRCLYHLHFEGCHMQIWKHFFSSSKFYVLFKDKLQVKVPIIDLRSELGEHLSTSFFRYEDVGWRSVWFWLWFITGCQVCRQMLKSAGLSPKPRTANQTEWKTNFVFRRWFGNTFTKCEMFSECTFFKSPTSSPMRFWHFKCVKYANTHSIWSPAPTHSGRQVWHPCDCHATR
jgi:hypothetical protein